MKISMERVNDLREKGLAPYIIYIFRIALGLRSGGFLIELGKSAGNLAFG